MENVEAMGRTLDPSQPWVKDSRGCHTNLAALLDWPDLDSDEEVCVLSFLLNDKLTYIRASLTHKESGSRLFFMIEEYLQ